jgi:hypothetical protein
MNHCICSCLLSRSAHASSSTSGTCSLLLPITDRIPFSLISIRSERTPGHKVCYWLRLLACQPLLYVVLPGSGCTLHQLCVLLCAEQLPGLVGGLRPGEGVEFKVLQDLQVTGRPKAHMGICRV